MRVQLAIPGFVVGSGKIDMSPAKERSDDRKRFFEACNWMVERKPEGAKLWLMPACAQTKNQTTIGNLVDRARHFGKERRIAPRRA